MRLLVIALSGNGDALMFTPAIKAIKKINPNIEIDALVMFKGVKDFYERNSLISNVYYYNFLNSNPISVFSNVIKLRGKYDYSINVYPSNRWEYNLISFLIGAKKRASTKYLRANSTNLSFLNNCKTLENDSLHNVEQNIKLIEKLFSKEVEDISGLDFTLNKEDVEFSEKFLEENSIEKNELVVGFHAGCQTLKNHINRRWAPDKFVELANKLILTYKCKVLLFGGPDEEELKNEISAKVNSKKIINVKTDSIAQSAALIKRCNLFVSNDSGLMHIAAAMQRKTVAIIGPTNTNYISPWKTEYKIASLNLECAPCFYYSPKPLTCDRTDLKFKCVKNLSVEIVFNTCKELLEESISN